MDLELSSKFHLLNTPRKELVLLRPQVPAISKVFCLKDSSVGAKREKETK